MRAAVTGLGGMGKLHVKSLLKLGATVTSVCDLRTEILQEFSPAVHKYQQWQELIEQEHGALDLLSVATNGPSHAEIVMGNTQAGIKYILCEKPLATSGKLAREMVAVFNRESTVLAVNAVR